MKFFIDTANINQIYEANKLGIIDGVTTNPSLINKEGINNKKKLYEHYIKICEISRGDVSAEVISTDYKNICYEGEALSKLDPKIVVKIPITFDGIKAIRYLSNKGIKTNCTLVFSVTQALLAAKVNATYVSPFLGRIDDISIDSLNLIKDIRIIYNNYNFNTKILAASIRHPIHIVNCAKFKIDVITSPLNILKNIIYHPFTEIGLKKFLDDCKL